MTRSRPIIKTAVTQSTTVQCENTARAIALALTEVASGARLVSAEHMDTFPSLLSGDAVQRDVVLTFDLPLGAVA